MNARRSFFRQSATLAVGGLAAVATSLVQARPQRGIIHVEAGDPNWTPTQEEMALVQELFHAADLDPKGAFVFTRPGIKVTRI